MSGVLVVEPMILLRAVVATAPGQLSGSRRRRHAPLDDDVPAVVSLEFRLGGSRRAVPHRVGLPVTAEVRQARCAWRMRLWDCGPPVVRRAVDSPSVDG